MILVKSDLHFEILSSILTFLLDIGWNEVHPGEMRESWVETTLATIFFCYSLKDIFNVDAFELFFQFFVRFGRRKVLWGKKCAGYDNGQKIPKTYDNFKVDHLVYFRKKLHC